MNISKKGKLLKSKKLNKSTHKNYLVYKLSYKMFLKRPKHSKKRLKVKLKPDKRLVNSL